MAKIIVNKIEYDVPDGARLDELFEKAGVPFSCNSGVCGTCQIEVKEGAENLEDLNQEETDLGMDKTHRLGCQCVVKAGIVNVIF